MVMTTFDASGRSSRSMPTTAMPAGNAFSSFRRSVLVTFSSDPPPTDRTKPPLSVFTMNGNGLSPGVSTTMRILPSWEETFTP